MAIIRSAPNKFSKASEGKHVPLACIFIVSLPEVHGEQPSPSGQANSGWLQLQPSVWQSPLQVLSILNSWLKLQPGQHIPLQTASFSSRGSSLSSVSLAPAFPSPLEGRYIRILEPRVHLTWTRCLTQMVAVDL